MCSTTTSNPAQIAIKASTTLHMLCVSHAAFYQQVVLSFNQNLSNPVAIFTGTGENVPMTASGQSLISIPTGTNTKLYAQFNFSTNGSTGPFKQATVCSPVISGTGPVVTQVYSEDSNDNDDNDSYLTVIDI